VDKEQRERLVGRQAPCSMAVTKGYDSNDTDKPVSGLRGRAAAHKIDI
jgi:hypothetical protein